MLLYSPRQNRLFPVLCRELCLGFLMLVLFFSNFGNAQLVTQSIQTKVTNSVITQIIEMGSYNLFTQFT